MAHHLTLEERLRLGDFEGDTVLGPAGTVTIVVTKSTTKGAAEGVIGARRHRARGGLLEPLPRDSPIGIVTCQSLKSAVTAL
jgi:hypothetical protein